MYKIDRTFLFGFETFPISNRIIFVCMNSLKNKIRIIHQAHARVLSIRIGWIKSRHPFEDAFGAASHLRFRDRTQRFAAPLDFERIHAAGPTRVRGGMDADA